MRNLRHFLSSPWLRIAAIATLVAPLASLSAQPWYYSGRHAGEVQHLLAKVPGWQRPTCLSCTDGKPPTVPLQNGSMRDTYVAEAVQYAWAVESYASLGETEKATQHASGVDAALAKANSLCSTVPTYGNLPGRTEHIWGCPPPRTTASPASPPPQRNGSQSQGSSGPGQAPGAGKASQPSPVPGGTLGQIADGISALRGSNPEEQARLRAVVGGLAGVVELFRSARSPANPTATKGWELSERASGQLAVSNFAGAEREFRAMLELDARCPFTNLMLGFTLAAQNRHDAAVEYYRAADAATPCFGEREPTYDLRYQARMRVAAYYNFRKPNGLLALEWAEKAKELAYTDERRADVANEISSALRWVAADSAKAENTVTGRTEAFVTDSIKSRCDAGDARACIDFGGQLTFTDEARAQKIFEDACRANDGYGCYWAAILHGSLRANYTLGFAYTRKGCTAGDIHACVMAAEWTLRGKGTPKETKNSLALLLEYCEKGSASGCHVVGDAYTEGLGVKRDLKKAREYLDRGCKLKSAEACASLKALK